MREKKELGRNKELWRKILTDCKIHLPFETIDSSFFTCPAVFQFSYILLAVLGNNLSDTLILMVAISSLAICMKSYRQNH